MKKINILLECPKEKKKLTTQHKNMNTIKLDRMLFIYALNGKIKCLSVEEIPESQSMMLAAGWKHTATIDPARWIEAMANGHNEPSDMLDEIQFKPNAIGEARANNAAPNQNQTF